MTVLPGVITRSRAGPRIIPVTEVLEGPPPPKKSRKVEPSTTPSPPHKSGTPVQVQSSPAAASNLAFEQWLDDVSNVDISLSICVGKPVSASSQAEQPPISASLADPPVLEATHSDPGESEEAAPVPAAAEFSVSIPTMLTRVLQSKLAIDPNRLTTQVHGDGVTSTDVFVALAVKGREEPILQAIEGGLTPRKAFLRSAPHISRVASRLQDCMRQIFGMKDFVVKVE